jgi:hypothetical protein
MARSINEAVEIEEPDHHEFLDVGPRALTAFEAARLAADPCRPIYMSNATHNALDWAYTEWLHATLHRSRSIPVTCTRQFVRSEGSL